MTSDHFRSDLSMHLSVRAALMTACAAAAFAVIGCTATGQNAVGQSASSAQAMRVVAGSGDVAFTLWNQSSVSVDRLYASPVGLQEFDRNLLDIGVLEPRGRTAIRVQGGRDQCHYDLRIVFADRHERIDEGVDLCHLADNQYVVTE
jgi:hypothetical protein